MIHAEAEETVVHGGVHAGGGSPVRSGDRTIAQVATDLDLTKTALRERVKRADVPFAASHSLAISLIAMAGVTVAVAVGRVEWLIALASIAPLMLAAAAFTILDRVLEEYWLVPSLGVYTLALALPFTLLRRPLWRQFAATVLVIAVVASLPTRWAHFTVDHRYGLYGPLVSVAAQIAKYGPPVRALIGPRGGVRPTTW